MAEEAFTFNKQASGHSATTALAREKRQKVLEQILEGFDDLP